MDGPTMSCITGLSKFYGSVEIFIVSQIWIWISKLLKFAQFKRKNPVPVWLVPSNLDIFLFFHQSSLTPLNAIVADRLLTASRLLVKIECTFSEPNVETPNVSLLGSEKVNSIFLKLILNPAIYLLELE